MTTQLPIHEFPLSYDNEKILVEFKKIVIIRIAKEEFLMKKILCLLTTGFEELEAVGTIALLRRANIQVDIVSLQSPTTAGRFDIAITNTKQLTDIQKEDYDGIFIPGGPHVKEMEASKDVQDLLNHFISAKKLVATICAAPTILGHMGHLKGKNYTCFTAMNEDFQGSYQNQYVAIDDNFITGRSVCATIDFGFALIAYLLGDSYCEQLKKEVYYAKG